MKKISVYLLALLPFASAQAQDARNFFNAQRSASRLYVWDSTGNNDNVLYNGGGTWNKTSSNWTRSAGRANDYWRDGGIAVFGGATGTGAAGTVTLGITPVVDSIGFASVPSGDFTISGMSISTARAALPVDVVSGRSPIISSAISGSIGINKTGLGKLILNGANTYTGITNIAAGTLQIGNGGSTGSAGTGEIACTGNLIFNRSTTDTLAALISGSGNFTKNGTGTLRLSGFNTYSGGTTINGGTLRSGSITAFGTGPVTVNSGDTLDTRVTAGNYSISNTVTVNPGGVWLKDGNGLYYNSTLWAPMPATYTGSQVLSGVNALAIQGTGDYGVSGNLTGAGSLAINPGANTLTFSGNNTYSGATSLFSGYLVAGSTTGFSAASSHTLSTGTIMDLAGFSNGVGSLAGTGNVVNSSGTAIFSAGANNASTTFSGIMKDSASGVLTFRKSGTGTLTLTGTSAYSGGTILNGGNLTIFNQTFLPAGKITATQNTVLTTTGPGAVFGTAYDWDIQSGATLTHSPASTGSFTTFYGKLTGSGTLGCNSWGLIFNGNDTAFTGSVNLNTGCFVSDTLASFPKASYFFAQSINLNAPGGGNYRFGDLQVGWGSFGPGISGLHTAYIGASNTSRTIAAPFFNGSGTLAIVKEGTGTYRLSGNSNYSGGTIINGGKLQAGSASAFGTGPITVNSGDTLDTRVSQGLYSIGNTVTVNPGGVWQKDADGFYFNGSLLLSTPGTYTSGLTGTLTNNVLAIQGGGSYEVSGNIGGGAHLVTNAGSGIIKLSGNNTYGGATFVSVGTLQIGSSNCISSANNIFIYSAGTIDLNGINIVLPSIGDAGTIINNGSTPATLTCGAGIIGTNTFSGVLKDGVSQLSLTKGGSGTQTLSGANTFTGNVVINAALSANRAATSSAFGAMGNMQIAGRTITVNPGGVFTLMGNNQFFATAADLATTQTQIVVAGGTMVTGANFSAIKSINIHSGGTVSGTDGLNTNTRSYGFCDTVHSVGGTGLVSTISCGGTYGGIHLGYSTVGATGTVFNIDNASGGLTVNANIYNRASAVTTASTLTKVGSGVLKLTGANGYTGATAVNAGTLAVTGSSTGSAHTVASGASISGGNSVSGAIGPLTFLSGGILSVTPISTGAAPKLSCTTLTAASGFTVDVLGAMTAGTYPILTSTSGTPAATLGVNNTGLSVSFAWTGNTLNMTVF